MIARVKNLSSVNLARLILGLILVLLAGWMIFISDKPWDFDQAKRAQWKTAEYAGYYSFWAAALNIGVLAGLILTAGWWAKTGGLVREAMAPATSKWFWPVVLAAMIFCGGAAAMRMNFGFAHDEDYSARRVIAGSYRLNDEGKVSGENLRWLQTFYYYRKPNNHPLHSILARLAVTIHRAVTPGEKWHMKEWVVRSAAWCGGVAAVGMLAVLLRRLVSPRAGMVAAWLLALHPWHIRYSSEARGYSLMLFLIPLVLYFWLRAVGENRWRWWLALAGGQFALVYCYPGSIYVLMVLNLLTAGWLLVRTLRTRDWITPGRWFAANCFAGMAALQLALPLVPQLQGYMNTEEARQPLTFEWQYNTAAHYLSGVSWSKTKALDSPHPELMPHAAKHPVFFGLLLAALTVFCVAGYFLLFRRKWPDAPIAAATLLFPGFIGFFIAKMLNQWLFEWYLIYLLPGLVAGIAVGVDALGNRLAARSRVPWLPLAPALALVVAYAIFSHPFRAWYCTNPLEPIKEAAIAMRGTLEPNDPRHKDVLTGIMLGKAWYYDPHATHLKSAEQFVELMKRADAENKPLYIMAPHPWAVAFNEPNSWRLFNEAGLFTDYQTFIGYDNTHNRVIARYVPGAVKDFDLEAFLNGRRFTPDPRLLPLAHPHKPQIYPQ